MVLDVAPISTAVQERVRKSARINSQGGLVHLAFEAMATHCQATFVAPSRDQAQTFCEELLDWVIQFESRYSRFIPESLVSRINQQAGKAWVPVDPETERIFQLCNEMNFMTRGVFDPTALPLIQLWNWKTKPSVLPSNEAVEWAKSLVGWRKVQRRPGAIFLPEPGMQIDLGGIGKEYAVDVALQSALKSGISDVLIDFGRDLKANGRPPGRGAWHIGLDDPRSPGKTWAGLGITKQAVATSGDYLRSFVVDGRRFGHIVDPRTGYPVANELLAVSVIAPSCTLAGILSTTAFILGAEEGLAMIDAAYGVEGCAITQQGRLPSRKFYEFVVS